MEQINATSLKRKLFYSTIYFIRRIALCQFPPWQIAVPRRITPTPYIIIKNIKTLLARSLYKQQVHRVLILSIWKKSFIYFFIYLFISSKIIDKEQQLLFSIFLRTSLQDVATCGKYLQSNLPGNYCMKVET